MKHFKHVVVSVRYPRETAKKNGFGLHRHAFGDPISVYDQRVFGGGRKRMSMTDDYMEKINDKVFLGSVPGCHNADFRKIVSG